MAYTKSDMKKGAKRFTVMDTDGDFKKVAADTAEEAQQKAEQFFGMEVFKISEIQAWTGGSCQAD